MAAAGPAAIALTLAATAASTYMQVKSANSEAQGYKEQRDAAKVAALDEEAKRRTELNRILSAQRAEWKGGDAERSGSFLARKRSDIETADRDISNIRFAGRQQVRSYSLARDQAKMAGTSAIFGGIASGASLFVGRTPTGAPPSGSSGTVHNSTYWKR